MDVNIHFNNEKKGELSYGSLPIYRLLCEQIGLQTQWNQKERILQLIPSFEGKKIYFASAENSDALTSVFADLKMFLSEVGVEFNQLDANATPPNDAEIFLQINWNANSSTQEPNFYIRYNLGFKGKMWAQAFYKEIKSNGFPAYLKVNKKRHPVSTLELHCHLPENTEKESLALLIMSALLRGLTKGNVINLLPYLSYENLQHILLTEQNNKSLHSTDVKVQTKKEKSSSKEKELRQSDIPDLRAEVYFDHQVVIPRSEDDSYLIVGNMYIKNIGNQNLSNPYICLRITPIDGIQLQGQIIPPNLVDTVGVQSFNGESATGWRYLEEDWLNKAKEKGEYWISPIQPLLIPPGEIEIFPNFQLSIPKKERNETFTMQGMVYFKDHNLQVPSNNRITLSF